jgi:hypothetical protein
MFGGQQEKNDSDQVEKRRDEPAQKSENCPHCFDNYQKHLILSIGKNVGFQFLAQYSLHYL